MADLFDLSANISVAGAAEASSALAAMGLAADAATTSVGALDAATAALGAPLAALDANLAATGASAASTGAAMAGAAASIAATGAAAEGAAAGIGALDVSVAGLEAALSPLLAALAPLIAIIASFETVKSAVTATADLEAAQLRLQQAVKNTGHSWEEYGPVLQATIDKQERLSTFTQTQLTEAMVRIVGLTQKAGEANEYFGEAVGLAVLKNIDLDSASQLVAKAINGNATMLNRQLGITGDAANALQVLRDRTKGYAEVESESLRGSIQKQENAWEKDEIALGKVITGSAAWAAGSKELAAALAGLEDWITANKSLIEEMIAPVGALIGALADLAKIIATAVVQAFQVLDFVVTSLVTGIIAAASEVWLGLGGILGAIGSLATSAAETLDKHGIHVLDGIGAKMTATAAGMKATAHDYLSGALAEFDATMAAIATKKGPFAGAAATAEGGKIPLEGIGGKGGAGTSATDDYIASLQAQLKVGQDAIALDDTRAEGIERLRAVEAQATLEEKNQNLTLEQRVALEKAANEATAALASTTGTALDPALAGLSAELDGSNAAIAAHEKGIRDAAEADQKWVASIGDEIDIYERATKAQATHAEGIAGLQFLITELEDKLASGTLSLEAFGRAMDEVARASKAMGESIKGGTYLAQAVDQWGAEIKGEMQLKFGAIAEAGANTLVDGIDKGIRAAITGKDPLKALEATVLAGLGNIFSQIGHELIASYPAFQALQAAISDPFTAGPAVLLAGVLFTALGAALGAIMSGSSGGGSGGVGSGGVGVVGSPTTTRTTLLDTAGGEMVGGMSRQPSVGPFVIIGPRDPSVQRTLAIAVQGAVRRGLAVS